MVGPPRRATSSPTPGTPPAPPGGITLQRHQSEPLPDSTIDSNYSIRHHVKFTQRRFDVTTLPADLQRVYRRLEADHNEDYALTFVFIVRTAIELHRAWHMTLLTSKILQMVKTRFDIRCTWNLGVVKLIFRVDDGGFELHRKVPYDYDSEFQDLYMKMAVALCEGHINIHEALIYQSETKEGLHTAPSGLFLRDNPGRLLLYPLEAATCAVIFFGGDWWDAAVAAICGFAAGTMEWILGAMSNYFGTGEVKILIDIMAGAITGIIGGLFYRFYESESFCLSSIFLGTLYWFFYGTAFVIGLLEIIAGELETGVTRFIAVSIKTFVLSMSAAIGLMIAVEENVYEAWIDQFKSGACNSIDLNAQWWRIPLYLLCSASALGQYRFPIANYWRGLIVQLVGYEVQYQVIRFLEKKHESDFLDTAASNICGAAAAVIIADIIRFLVDECGRYYTARLLDREVPDSLLASCLYHLNVGFIRFVNLLHLGRKTQLKQLQLEEILRKNVQEIRDPNHPRQDITLTAEEEKALVEAIVEAHGLNLWSLLMPAVYQLVPGSMIARLWFNALFPPPLKFEERDVGGSRVGDSLTYVDRFANPEADDVFYGLMVTSLSLALGLIIGQSVCGLFSVFFRSIRRAIRPHREETEEEIENRKRREKFHNQGVMVEDDSENDPDGGGGGGQTNKKTDEPMFGKSWRNLMGTSKRDVTKFSINEPPPIKTSTQTATTYTPMSDGGESSVRLRAMNQGVGVLMAVNENDNNNNNNNNDDDEETAPNNTNGATARSTTPTLLKVHMDKVAEDYDGIEISNDDNKRNNNIYQADVEDHV